MHSSRMRTVRSSSCFCPGGRGAWSWGVPGPGRVPGSRGYLVQGGLLLGGCLLPGGGGIPAFTEADTPPVNRMTDKCKNITFATSLRTVIKIVKNILNKAAGSICDEKTVHAKVMVLHLTES